MDVARIPQRTLLLGGALVATAGSVALLVSAAPWLDAPLWALDALAGPIATLVAALLLFAGMALLGIGIGTETGIGGRRALGIALVVAYGTAWLVPYVLAMVPLRSPVPLPLGAVAAIVLVAVGLGAAFAVLVAERVPGVARGALLLVVLCQLPSALAAVLGTPALVELAGRLEPLWPASFAVLGTMLLAAARIRVPARSSRHRRAR